MTTGKTILAIGLLAVWAASPAGVGAEVATKIKLATLAPKGSSFANALAEMGEKWRQAPGGGVALNLFTDGSMGGEADMVRKMRFGQLQGGLLTAVGLSEIEKSVSALQFMPMMFRSWEEVDFVLEKLKPRLEKSFEEKGFVALFWTYTGWVRYFSKQPVLTPDDLKKLKIFAWAGGSEGVDLMKNLGYQPVALETADILPSLQTGLINAVPSIPVYANAGQFYNHAPHMLELNWVPIVGGAVVTKKVWDKLAPATQEAMRKAALEAGQKIRDRGRKENDEAIQAMKKRGLQVHAVTPEIEAAWRKLAESAYPSIRGRIVPADIFDEVEQLLKTYRATTPRTAP